MHTFPVREQRPQLGAALSHLTLEAVQARQAVVKPALLGCSSGGCARRDPPTIISALDDITPAERPRRSTHPPDRFKMVARYS